MLEISGQTESTAMNYTIRGGGTPEDTAVTPAGVLNASDTAEKRSCTETFTGFGSTASVIGFICFRSESRGDPVFRRCVGVTYR